MSDESMGANDIQGVGNLNPKGMVERIYVEDHLTFVHTKYISCRPHAFFVVPCYKFRKPQDIATKYISCGSRGFQRSSNPICTKPYAS